MTDTDLQAVSVLQAAAKIVCNTPRLFYMPQRISQIQQGIYSIKKPRSNERGFLSNLYTKDARAAAIAMSL